MSEITGHCLCGNVKYAVEATDAKASVCHCEGCRRASAAPAVAWITVMKDDFRVIQGELKTVCATETGPDTCDAFGGTRSFCAKCGSQILFVGDDRQEVVDITTCTLDNPDDFVPVEDVFAYKKLAWMKHLA